MNGAAGPGDDRRINHFAVERNDAGTLLLSFFNDDKNALAQAISFAVGANALWITLIWRGLMANFPLKPKVRAF